METGNPKQVAVLCVMAVGALGFLATRLVGKHDLQAVALASRSESRKAEIVPSDSPLLIDPFSHPKLAPAKPSVPSTELSGTSVAMRPLDGSIGGVLPVASDPSDEYFSSPEGDVASGDKSGDKKGTETKTDAPKPAEQTEVALEATAGASEDVAFLSVDGADSRPFHPNDSIKNKVRLLSIEDGAVVLSGPTGKLTINVGEHKRI